MSDDFSIVNITACYNIGVSYINLAKLVFENRDIPFMYNPSNYAACQLIIKESDSKESKILLFSTGSVNHIGGYSYESILFTAWKFVHMLSQRLNIPARILSFNLNNFVAVSMLDFPIDVERYYEENKLSGKMSYDPDKFPGCRIRDIVQDKDGPKKNSNYVIQIFPSGKIINTGSSDLQYMKNQTNKLKKELLKYKAKTKQHAKAAKNIRKKRLEHEQMNIRRLEKKIEFINAYDNAYGNTHTTNVSTVPVPLNFQQIVCFFVFEKIYLYVYSF